MAQTVKDFFNPNPISKLCGTVLISFTVLHPIGFFGWGVAGWLALFFWLNGYRLDAVKVPAYFSVLYFLPGFDWVMALPSGIKMFVALLLVAKMFYLPFVAGKFLIKSSDVGHILSAMDKCRVPAAFSIPVAVMFRFFPSFKEDHRHIRQAMKIRGISLRHPLRYAEYVTVPLLVISSTLADDIAMAAETRGIARPGVKTRYREVSSKGIDVIFLAGVMGLVIGGWLWFK
ncbi:energy-coupling factor transporter transmembrane component T family protein [Peptococcus simiae]|uniref:Energy-coupling factor transporter transmembrane component T family protein n=1 Tax=Peptococcus simiae TaxID=1643805 RepID=A0ABW9GZ16_9FIRM